MSSWLASQKIQRHLWSSNSHYCVFMSPPLDPILTAWWIQCTSLKLFPLKTSKCCVRLVQVPSTQNRITKGYVYNCNSFTGLFANLLILAKWQVLPCNLRNFPKIPSEGTKLLKHDNQTTTWKRKNNPTSSILKLRSLVTQHMSLHKYNHKTQFNKQKV
jgi:hypothetical protein